ncbi:MAG: N-acetylglucosamine-6-phosphate deacetylase [Candidatus Atribacteria bacterium]|nr:N-acetylglucosamine-6-phosphate deacetylase [Candidatus Atribacteria bacterium]
MKSFGIKGQIVTPSRVIPAGTLLIEGKEIGGVFSPDEEKGKLPLLDFGEAYIFPGLIDLHIHGARGKDFMDANLADTREISRFLLEQGVTGFLATTLTEGKERIKKAISAMVAFAKEGFPGSKMLGIHLEGPYLSCKRRGAHNPAYLRSPDREETEELLAAGQGWVKRVTLAPELPGAMDLITYLATQDILVSLGHSQADYQTSLQAFEKGAQLITHLFNGMDPLHHRQPNLLSFALGFDQVWVEMIADTIHVAPEIMKIALKCKGERMILISDAVRPTGLGDGSYEFGGETMEVKDGIARITPSQSLAGSTITLNQALSHLKKHFNLSLPRLADLGSLSPAKLLRVDKKLGSLERGKMANVVVFDQSFQPKEVFLEGEMKGSDKSENVDGL